MDSEGETYNKQSHDIWMNGRVNFSWRLLVSMLAGVCRLSSDYSLNYYWDIFHSNRQTPARIAHKRHDSFQWIKSDFTWVWAFVETTEKTLFLFLVRSLSVLISIILQWRNLRAIREIQKVDRSSPWIVGNSTTSYFETPTRWPKMGSPNARYQNLEIGLRSKWSWRVSQIFPCVQFSLWLNNDEPTHFAIDFHSHSLVSLPITFIKVTRYRWTKCRHKKAKSSP